MVFLDFVQQESPFDYGDTSRFRPSLLCSALVDV